MNFIVTIFIVSFDEYHALNSAVTCNEVNVLFYRLVYYYWPIYMTELVSQRHARVKNNMKSRTRK